MALPEIVRELQLSDGSVNNLLDKLDAVLQMALTASDGAFSGGGGGDVIGGVEGMTELPASDNNGNTPAGLSFAASPAGEQLYKLTDQLLFLQVEDEGTSGQMVRMSIS